MSGLVLDKIFFEGNCSTPWLLTREDVVSSQSCLDFSNIRCTNNTLLAFYSQSCTINSVQKSVNFDHVRALTKTDKKLGGPYEFVYRADGRCRQYNTIAGQYGNGVAATCVDGKSQIQQCDNTCNNCTNVNMTDYFTDYSCKVFPKNSATTLIPFKFLVLMLLVNIF
eukprot:NODE_57_length_28844_cov_0.352687.p20 type:complete len:167 gc:universal NODE_57_length_28844_cov_0.352687:18841-18341(-)